MQGQLRNEKLVAELTTECTHCGQELHLTLDSELNWSVKESDANPLVFEPEIDWDHFDGPNIIGDY